MDSSSTATTDLPNAESAAVADADKVQPTTTSLVSLSSSSAARPDPNSDHGPVDPSKIQTITEGSVCMCFPADQATAVFYNPVQVQNRDLSILMITLFAERRALQRAQKAQRKLENQRQRQEQQTEGQHHQPEAPSQAPPPSLSVVEGHPTSAMGASLDPQHHGLTILDALAASGLRSLRYWKEIPGVKHVTINDLDPAAVERSYTNIQFNELTSVLIDDNHQDDLIAHHDPNGDKESTKVRQVDPRPYGIRIQHGDATQELYNSRRAPNMPVTVFNTPAGKLSRWLSLQQQKPQWDVIDLDPYGSAAPFLDGAVQAIQSGGLLCVTCTDMAALGGSHPETCYGRYAAMPLQRAGYLQEAALRILLYRLATAAATYGRTIKPILSVGMNFYIRVFVEVMDSKAGVNALSLQIGQVYQSTQCPSYRILPMGQLGGKKGTVYQAGRSPPDWTCPETGSGYKIGGPLWLGPLHDPEVLQEALQRLESSSNSTDPHVYPQMKWLATRDRLIGLLQSCLEELPDVPLYYKLTDLSQTLQVSSPPLIEVKAALINAGYRVSGYHKEPQAIKTDAPNHVLWDIMRAWCQKHPPAKAPPSGSAAQKILAISPEVDPVDFTIPRVLREAQKNKTVPRFPMNPQPNWGPKPRASGHKRKAESDADDVRVRR